MPVVNVSELEDGATLLRDAVDGRGNAVLPAGSRIDARARARLAEAGVQRVSVSSWTSADAVAKPGETLKKPDTVMVQQSLLRLARMFNPHRDDKLMRELCRLAIKCAQERLISA